MLTISNVKVYDLKESVIACRNAMRIRPAIVCDEEFNDSLLRAKKLAKAPAGSGEETFLSGIRVAFDIVYPNYISPELQRYHWVDIVSSSSKMHSMSKMDFRQCCNKYVDPRIIEVMEEYRDCYNNTPDSETELKYYYWMKLISNCPQGLELFMRVDTNYLQLKTIYRQRKHHKLKEDWGAFCDFIETLPYASDFITFEE